MTSEGVKRTELGNDVMLCAHANSGGPQKPLSRLLRAPLDPPPTIHDLTLPIINPHKYC